MQVNNIIARTYLAVTNEFIFEEKQFARFLNADHSKERTDRILCVLMQSAIPLPFAWTGTATSHPSPLLTDAPGSYWAVMEWLVTGPSFPGQERKESNPSPLHPQPVRLKGAACSLSTVTEALTARNKVNTQAFLGAKCQNPASQTCIHPSNTSLQ